MNVSDRDKKIALVLIPLVVAAAYWFLVLSPKRAEATKLGERLQQVEQERDAANARAGTLENARASYAKDYAAVVRVGKAVPGSLDMPSLIVQLDQAAEGTGIRFKRIKTGERADAPPPPTPAPSSGGSAASGPGQARDSANSAAATSEQASAASGAAPANGAAAPAGGAPAGTSGVAGLDSVPLEFTFTGSFFDLADFFHQMKRFVRVANENVKVQGRLLTIDGFNFESSAFPTLKTEVQATVYLAPKSQGTTAGATPTGPAPATQQASSAQPAPAPAAPPAGAPAPASTSGDVQ